MNKTLSIIKPDATKRNITGSINKIIEDNGLRIIAQKRIILSDEQAKEFYKVHNDKPFFNDLIEYMTSEPVIVQVLESENAVEKYRNTMGSTNPEEASDGTIRKIHALNIQENSVAIINYSTEDNFAGLAITESLRNQFEKISFYSTDSSSNIDKQYKQAEQIKPKYILFFGDEEIKSNTYTIKDSRDKVKKEKISKNELIKIFDKINK